MLIILIFSQHYKTITQSISYLTQIRHVFRCESPRKFLFTRYSHSTFSVYIFTTFFYSYRTLRIISYMSGKQSHPLPSTDQFLRFRTVSDFLLRTDLPVSLLLFLSHFPCQCSSFSCSTLLVSITNSLYR